MTVQPEPDDSVAFGERTEAEGPLGPDARRALTRGHRRDCVVEAGERVMDAHREALERLGT